MGYEVLIQLFGSLGRPERGGTSSIVIPCSNTLSLDQLLSVVAVERERVQVVFANGRPVNDEYMVRPGDRISIFPKEYPIFADWKDFRKGSPSTPETSFPPKGRY